MEIPDYLVQHLPEIEEAAWRGYEQAAYDSGGIYTSEQAFAMGSCRKVALEIRYALRDLGIEHTLHRRGTEALRLDEHQYLETSHKLSKIGGVLIDATWQQFIPKPDSKNLPRIFIGQRHFLQNMAADLGAEEWAVNLWNETGPEPWVPPAERIARAYDEQMRPNNGQ